MSIDDIQDSLQSHREMLLQLIKQQEQLISWVQLLKTSYEECKTDIELVNMRLKTLENPNDTCSNNTETTKA